MFRVAVRRFATSAVRRGHYEEGPGKNMPFSVDNKWRFLAATGIFVGVCTGLPLLMMRNLFLR